jgi:D-3-phosphoglycerate dehydrogenase / 2-oxoglutarate reductase
MSRLQRFVILASLMGTTPPSPEFLKSVARLLPEGFALKVPPAWDERTIRESAADADAILGTRVPGSLIASAPKLRFVQAIGSGVDKVDLDAAAKRGVLVCSAVGENATLVAEHALALTLGLAKNLHVYQREFHGSGKWVRIPSLLLSGKTLGIIGLGTIGTEIARRARPLGMRVIAIKKRPDRSLKRRLGLDFLGGPESLEKVLGESDVVILSAVLTRETRGMIGRAQLRKMKRNALLINVARGELVDEAALVRALRDGKIAGAGLDTFEREPIDPGNPLLRLNNVILTPHVAGGAWRNSSERASFLARNITKALKGGRPENVVDPALGYAQRT